MQGQLQVLDALLQYCLSHSDAFIVGQAGRAARVETQAAVLHDSKGSFWLQSLDQSERRSAFLQQEHQKFNLDRFTKKLSALYPNWQLSTSADIPDSQLIVIEGNVSEKWQCWVCTCQTDFLWNRQRSRMESVFTRRGEWKRFVVSACKRVFHAGERFCVTFLNYSNRCRCFFLSFRLIPFSLCQRLSLNPRLLWREVPRRYSDSSCFSRSLRNNVSMSAQKGRATWTHTAHVLFMKVIFSLQLLKKKKMYLHISLCRSADISSLLSDKQRGRMKPLRANGVHVSMYTMRRILLFKSVVV